MFASLVAKRRAATRFCAPNPATGRIRESLCSRARRANSRGLGHVCPSGALHAKRARGFASLLPDRECGLTASRLVNLTVCGRSGGTVNTAERPCTLRQPPPVQTCRCLFAFRSMCSSQALVFFIDLLGIARPSSSICGAHPPKSTVRAKSGGITLGSAGSAGFNYVKTDAFWPQKKVSTGNTKQKRWR
jgi:hypothetical protein